MNTPAITPSHKNAILLIGTILIVAAIGFDIYRRSGQAVPGNETQREQQAAEVLAKVGKLIEVPTEPAPALATIADVETLRTQNAFYNKAKNGDVLVVTQTRAILYDPEKNQIIDVVPVQFQQPQQAQQPQASSSSVPAQPKK